MQTFNTKSNIAVYYELTKPKIWYLLVFTAFGAAITASNVFNVPISLETWALLLGGVAAGSAAANTLTNYHDRDIDAIMDETQDAYENKEKAKLILAQIHDKIYSK